VANLLCQKSREESDPLARVPQTKRVFSLKKPRPLGTRNREFWPADFNGKIILMGELVIEFKRLTEKLKLKIFYCQYSYLHYHTKCNT
jgi:hypothetical protein